MRPKTDSPDTGFRLPVTITVANARAVTDHALAALRSGAHVLDFSAVQTLDSSAIAVAFACEREAVRLGFSLQYLHFPENLMSLARLYGVDGFFAFS